MIEKNDIDLWNIQQNTVKFINLGAFEITQKYSIVWNLIQNELLLDQLCIRAVPNEPLSVPT